jgi:hypothetical protein
MIFWYPCWSGVVGIRINIGLRDSSWNIYNVGLLETNLQPERSDAKLWSHRIDKTWKDCSICFLWNLIGCNAVDTICLEKWTIRTSE